jgi:hypothetical protein
VGDQSADDWHYRFLTLAALWLWSPLTNRNHVNEKRQINEFMNHRSFMCIYCYQFRYAHLAELMDWVSTFYGRLGFRLCPTYSLGGKCHLKMELCWGCSFNFHFRQEPNAFMFSNGLLCHFHLCVPTSWVISSAYVFTSTWTWICVFCTLHLFLKVCVVRGTVYNLLFHCINLVYLGLFHLYLCKLI